jgi:XTP/dITP diphosphohydrolase
MPPRLPHAPPERAARVPRLRLVLASANPGKLREFRALLDGLPFEVLSQSSLGVEAPEETARTFLGNALIKARHAAQVTGLAALADDSGLEVDALGGAPGVHSARFAGSQASDAENNSKLLQALEHVPPSARTARYRCALVFLESATDPAPLVAEAAWEGLILGAPRGAGGFGYDPYFWVPELGLSAAELAPDRKNSLSHRGRALAQLRAALSERAASAGGS